MFQQISRKNRKISQEQTRGRLIDAGREHFLRFGLAGATSERIAAAAGFTRGALYANFDNLDDLFVAVMSANSDRDLLMFRTIFEKAAPALERFARIREAYAGLVTEAPWVLLQAEFQANALRRSAMRAAYVEQQARRAAQGAAMIREMAEELDLRLAGDAGRDRGRARQPD